MKTAVSQSYDDLFNMSCGSRWFEDVQGECGGKEQHFASTSVPCRHGG